MTGDADDDGTLFSPSNTNITYLPQSTPAQIVHIATLYPDGSTQGEYALIGTRRFLLEHVSKTQNTWINFINTLDPIRSGTKANVSQTVFWPKWNTSTSDGLLDPGVINVTSENFRVDAIQFLLGLLLEEASG
ncbi:hypothetical protein B0H16DRAFT_1545216 [Mycena metata]|uniref:Uncharacterized protein n=1 Tax=Mycena metata TaxID=1033252 RepID=A0AAD7J023_9AGAR|nr:hypothetical protein B0H16DRAFT_1545216 [Mycena metata]